MLYLVKNLKSKAKNTSNYITLLKAEEGAYYQGEKFDGSVVLGRKGGAKTQIVLSLRWMEGN